ncbi:hypothetical protein FQZ97_576370 [compost metagenome]
MEFVEDHQADAVQRRVVLQAAGEDALGDHLDARPRADLAVQADAVADRFADLLAQLAGQPLGGGARGQPARLEHEDALPGQPRLAEQYQRHAGGLAGAGRRLQHHFVAQGEGGAQVGENGIDGQNGHGNSHYEAGDYNGEPPAAGRGQKWHPAMLRQPPAWYSGAPFQENPMRMQSRLIGGVLVATLVTQLTACGTLFFPERRGQIEGRIDPAVAAMNAIGILFYVIPGLIAFAVDFATGAIYLPDDQTAQVDPALLQQTIGADGQIDRQQLKALIERETGHSLPLDDPRLLQRSGSLQQLAAYGLQPAA